MRCIKEEMRKMKEEIRKMRDDIMPTIRKTEGNV